MHILNEFIWIGNTLYPRWVIFAAIILLAAAVLAVGAICRRFPRG